MAVWLLRQDAETLSKHTVSATAAVAMAGSPFPWREGPPSSQVEYFLSPQIQILSWQLIELFMLIRKKWFIEI